MGEAGEGAGSRRPQSSAGSAATSALGLVERGLEQRRELGRVRGELEELDTDALGEVAHVAPRPRGAEDRDASARHESRPEEGLATGVFIVTVDEHVRRAQTEERVARRFRLTGEE